MASFKIYAYQFSPAIEDEIMTETLFGMTPVTSDSVMLDKQTVFQTLFSDGSGFAFSKGLTKYNHQVILNENGIIVLRIANNKKLRQEENFKIKELVNQPSCVVVIDNRGDCQSMAIQDKSRAFVSTDQVAKIMTASLNEALKASGLVVEIRRRIEENTFWNLLDRYPEGVRSIRFEIAYPNLPRVSDNVDALFRSVCKELGATSSFQLNAIQGQTLNLSKSSELLSGLVKASSESGHPIKVLPAEKNARWVSTGTDSSVSSEMNDKLFSMEETLFHDRFEQIAKSMNKYK